MKLTDQIKAALAKKQAAQHPATLNADSENKTKSSVRPVLTNKPQKRVTGRGR